MSTIYKFSEGARQVETLYREILNRWPVPNQHLRVPTRAGETFVIACGPENARHCCCSMAPVRTP